MSDFFWYISIGLSLLVVILLTLIGAKETKHKRELEELDTHWADLANEMMIMARKDALERQRSVIKGQLSENIAPFLSNFGYNASDCRFMGNPVDYIVFDGLSDGDVKEVVIMDIKTGTSRLNKNQRLIRDAVKDGKVRFEVLKIDKD
jgi:predicted Holliday junction resolvase-like endonuclease